MPLPDEQPMEGWKAIANYLGRPIRTLQRWERKGLPIHRHDARGPIAYSSEIDAWMKTFNPRNRQEPDPTSPTEIEIRKEPIQAHNPKVSLEQRDRQPVRSSKAVSALTAFFAGPALWLYRRAFIGLSIAFLSLLVLAVLTAAYGVAILVFCLGAACIATCYGRVRDTPVKRAFATLYIIAAMSYIASASTMLEFNDMVINVSALPPATTFLFVIGLKFVPLILLVLLYWVLFAFYDDVGFLAKPIWEPAYWLLGILFLATEFIFLGVGSGDDRIWQADVTGRWILFVASLVVLAANVAVWIAGWSCFRRDVVRSYRPLFSACAISYLIISVASFFIDHEHNLFNLYYLDVRWPQKYVVRNPGIIASMKGPQPSDGIGPDLASLFSDPEFNRALREGNFYRQHSDEEFQLFNKSMMFAYKRPSSSREHARFVAIRFPKKLAEALGFQPIGD